MLMNLQSGAKRNKRNSCAARDRQTALGQPVEQLVCDKLGCAAVYLILQLYYMLVRYIDYKAQGTCRSQVFTSSGLLRKNRVRPILFASRNSALSFSNSRFLLRSSSSLIVAVSFGSCLLRFRRSAGV